MTQRLTAGASDTAAGASAPAAISALETALCDLESRVIGMREALKSGDAATLDQAADELKSCLSRAKNSVMTSGALRPAALAPYRERLRLATIELQTQREALARAAAAVDRATGILMPASDAAYDAQGLGTRRQAHGSVTA